MMWIVFGAGEVLLLLRQLLPALAALHGQNLVHGESMGRMGIVLQSPYLFYFIQCPHTHINLNRLIAADRFEGLLLQHTEQLDLSFR